MIEKISNHFGQRHLIVQGYTISGDELHINKFAAALLAELHQRTIVNIRRIDFKLHIGLFDRFTLLWIGQGGRVIHHQGTAIDHGHLIDHRRCCDNQIQVVLTLEALLHNLHVQQAQESATKTKAHGAAGFRLKFERRIG